MKNLKILLVITVVLLMLPKQSYSQTLSITKVQRDSIYNKIERGKINAERVIHLNGALASCDSIKALQVSYIGVLEFHNKSKDQIILNDQEIITALKENATYEKKRGRKKAVGNFFKGMAIGAGIVTIIIISI